MSEYQYYEFQTIDRPLTQGEMAELRKISSRASITPTRLHNIYNYGDFRGDPLKLMERYFDAFVYVANWGTHRFMVRLPRDGFEPPRRGPTLCRLERSCPYPGQRCHPGVRLAARRESPFWVDEEETAGWLPALLPLRAELPSGDARALYLAWLAGIYADDDELDDDALEPPVPPGLGQLSAALTMLAEFLRLDEDLLAVAAAASPDLPAPPAAAGSATLGPESAGGGEGCAAPPARRRCAARPRSGSGGNSVRPLRRQWRRRPKGDWWLTC